jgi:hypothetical protein
MTKLDTRFFSKIPVKKHGSYYNSQFFRNINSVNLINSLIKLNVNSIVGSKLMFIFKFDVSIDSFKILKKDRIQSLI